MKIFLTDVADLYLLKIYAKFLGKVTRNKRFMDKKVNV